MRVFSHPYLALCYCIVLLFLCACKKKKENDTESVKDVGGQMIKAPCRKIRELIWPSKICGNIFYWQENVRLSVISHWPPISLSVSLSNTISTTHLRGKDSSPHQCGKLSARIKATVTLSVLNHKWSQLQRSTGVCASLHSVRLRPGVNLSCSLKFWRHFEASFTSFIFCFD